MVATKKRKVIPASPGRTSALATHVSREGFENLQAELERLRTEGRSDVAELIHKAKEIGDITDSAQYEAAKDAQAFLEGRIRTLELQLSSAVVVSQDGLFGMVSLGSRVTIADGAGEAETYRIVSPVEASIAQGRISMVAPVGKALLGRKAGDKVVVQAPNGVIHYTVLKVE